MRIKFWGTRGSISVPGGKTTVYGGNTTCLEMTLQGGKRLIVDAGTGIRALGDRLGNESGVVDIHLLVTHIHWDHIIGFPFFTPIYDPSSKILIDGYHTCMKGLRYTFDNRMGDGFFPIRFVELKAEIKYLERLRHGELEIDGTLIDRVPLQHPQGGFGFRFRENGKILVFITDNELRKDPSIRRPPDKYAKFCKNADVLIHDAQYTPEEIDGRRGWGHSDYQATFDLAHEAGVKRLVLFHHDPSRTDEEVTGIKDLCWELAEKKKSGLTVEAAKENSELQL